jgi:phosphatidylinositol alpha-1,6-mannosyltransferase
VWWATLPGSRSLLRRIGDAVDELTYVSEYCRSRIAPALSPAAAARMTPLRPTVDQEKFRPGCGGAAVRRRLGIPADALVVVCVARLVRRKGQDTLVKAWPDVLRAHPDARLLLVGKGPDRGRLERLIDARGVRDSVTMMGGVTAADLPSHLDAGDVFAMPCRTRRLGLEVEAWGIVFLEALACGLPVVVGNSGGAPETIEALGDRGVVADTVPSVAAALVRLIEQHAGTPRQNRTAATPWTWEGATRELARLLTLPAS